MIHISKHPRVAFWSREKVSGLPAHTVRRSLLMAILGGLLTASMIVILTSGESLSSVHASWPILNLSGLSSHSRAETPSNQPEAHIITQAVRGDCLMWPENNLQEATIVSCDQDHKFEVAASIDMGLFPGMEYGPQAPPPSEERISQITQEQCETTVRHYLGQKFDPHGKFTAGMLWGGNYSWSHEGERHILCGLELAGLDNQQLVFSGRVSEIDQSNIWPAGTCLGIDEETDQPNDIPVDCTAPHAKEITGSVNLEEQFPDAFPSEDDQDDFIKKSCARITKEYLAPVPLRDTTLTLTYTTISIPSWLAGSREVACGIGTSLGDGRWATLINSARENLLINGQPPVPPSEIPPERLNLLPDYN